jgi:hypothetical protein
MTGRWGEGGIWLGFTSQLNLNLNLVLLGGLYHNIAN